MLNFIMICSPYSIKSFEDSYSRKSQCITKKKKFKVDKILILKNA